MNGLSSLKRTDKLAFIFVSVVILLMAFFQAYYVSHDLSWSYDVDIHRDMAYVQGNLYGEFGKDANLPGAYLWYNPLLTISETLFVKISGLPVHTVLTRAGLYLNALGPIVFLLMMLVIADYKVSIAALISYLFLASGELPSYYAATYSPWLYPVCFSQFFFYLNIILCYKAFSSQKNIWFLILGAFIGISFLSHTAPTILIIFIMAFIQLPKIKSSIIEKDYASLKKYLLQSIITLIPFVITSLPLTYYIVGKYHMHFLNRMPFEYVDTIFIVHNFRDMIKSNLSISFVVSAIGFVWFYRNFHQPLIRKIIFGWLITSVVMYVYSTAVATLDNQYKIHLPGSVPSYHFFYYLKALQSVFYGFGFVFLLSAFLKKINNNIFVKYGNVFLISAALLCAIIYFPFYQKRFDFVYFRQQDLKEESDKDGIATYNYILQNVPVDNVILCEDSTSIFPVMPTARKMVSIGITFSNPYLDFFSRENAREEMVSFLTTGQPFFAQKLFNQYQVNFVLLKNTTLKNSKSVSAMLKHPVFKNDTYLLYKL